RRSSQIATSSAIVAIQPRGHPSGGDAHHFRHDRYRSRTGVPAGLRSHPSNLIRFVPAKGVPLVPRCLTIATSDSGGGAGVQADLKAFAAAGCHGTSALVALTAQNTTAVTAVQTLPSEFV